MFRIYQRIKDVVVYALKTFKIMIRFEGCLVYIFFMKIVLIDGYEVVHHALYASIVCDQIKDSGSSLHPTLISSMFSSFESPFQFKRDPNAIQNVGVSWGAQVGAQVSDHVF